MKIDYSPPEADLRGERANSHDAQAGIAVADNFGVTGMDAV